MVPRTKGNGHKLEHKLVVWLLFGWGFVCLSIFFFFSSGWTLAQVVQGSFGVFILGDIPELTDHGSGQAALAGPTWARVWTRWPPEVPDNFSLSVINNENNPLSFFSVYGHKVWFGKSFCWRWLHLTIEFLSNLSVQFCRTEASRDSCTTHSAVDET